MLPRILLLASALALAAGCSKGGDKPAPGPAKPDDGQVAAAPKDAAPPQPETRDARCKAGDTEACDAIAEYWSYRQVMSPERIEQGKVDAAALHVACDEEGSSSACMGLALMYKYGSATGEPDGKTSGTYWGRVAELGDLNGFRGKEPTPEGKAALEKTVSECEAGRARACNQAGWAAFGAVQREKSVADAYAFYAKGCEAGSGQGCHWAGHFAYVYPDETGAGDQAEAHLREGCEELENPGACDELGVYLMKQMGDADKAAPLFEKACDRGYRTACHHLAKQLAEADGDAAKIAELDTAACEAGEDPACLALAARVKKCAYPADDADLAARALAAAKAYCADEGGDGCDAVKSCE